jgi:hypothetical protein
MPGVDKVFEILRISPITFTDEAGGLFQAHLPILLVRFCHFDIQFGCSRIWFRLSCSSFPISDRSFSCAARTA